METITYVRFQFTKSFINSSFSLRRTGRFAVLITINCFWKRSAACKFWWWMWLLLKNVSPNADWEASIANKRGGGDTVRMHRAIWSVWSIGGGVWQGLFILGLCLQQLSPWRTISHLHWQGYWERVSICPGGSQHCMNYPKLFYCNIYCREVTTCTNLTFDTICM